MKVTLLLVLVSLLASSSWGFPLVQQRSRPRVTELTATNNNNNNKNEEDNLNIDLTNQFATGKTLDDLRSDIQKLQENLVWAKAVNDSRRCRELEDAIHKGQLMDPELVYQQSLDELKLIQKSVLLTEAMKQEKKEYWQRQGAAARECLPRFQMEGLWMGNQPSAIDASSTDNQDDNLINVTYTGDTLVATHVHSQKISFKADLAPVSNTSEAFLEPIQFSNTSLPRYQGKGSIDNLWVDGQIVLFDQHFSFVWIPTRVHTLFRRPSPHQILRALRNDYSERDEREQTMRHLEDCMQIDMTESIARHHAKPTREPLRRIQRQEEWDALALNVAPKETYNFWQVHKWSQYIGKVLDGGSKKNES